MSLNGNEEKVDSESKESGRKSDEFTSLKESDSKESTEKTDTAKSSDEDAESTSKTEKDDEKQPETSKADSEKEAEEPKPTDEHSEDDQHKLKESSKEGRESSDAAEGKEPVKLQGILKKSSSHDEAQKSSEDPSKLSSRKEEDKTKEVEEFKIPDDLKEPKKSVSLDDSPFPLTSMKISKEKHKPQTQTSKEKHDLYPGVKSDPKHSPAQKKSSSGEIQPVEPKTSEKDDEKQPETPKADSENESDESESTDGQSKEDQLKLKESTKESDEEPEAPKRKRKGRLSFTEHFKKKKSSVVQFFTGRSSKKKDKPREDKPRRSSFIMRKFIALEKELTTDSINQKVTRIFHPEPLEKDVEKAEDEEEPPKSSETKRVYLSSAMACMFIVGVASGSALSALPFYLRQSSWFGVFFNILLGLNGIYAGLCTGWCWKIMEEVWPEYLEYSRIPYQDIAFRAVGTRMKYLVAICVDITILATCASYILIIAGSLEDLIFRQFHFCYSVIVITAILIPGVMFNSYRNIKIIGVLDVLFSILFTLLLIVAFFFDKQRQGIVQHTAPTFQSAAMSFAGFSFAYGVGQNLPSIMVDMADKNMFSQTLVTAYMIIMVIYLLLPIMGYAAYGDNTPEYILKAVLVNDNLHNLAIAIEVFFILQVATTFIVSLIPTLHSFEVRVNCPDRFGIGRFLVRLAIMAAILVVVLAIPYLPKYVSFIGATAMNLTTFIFPPLLYVCLVRRTESKKMMQKRVINKRSWCLVAEIIVLGVFIAVLAIYMSVDKIKNFSEERISCYENISYIPETKMWLLDTKHGDDIS